jgi:hypothetical protein
MRSPYLRLIPALLFLAALPLLAQDEDDPILRGSVWVIAAVHQDAHQQSMSDDYKASTLLKYLETSFGQNPKMALPELQSRYDMGLAVLDNTLSSSTDEARQKVKAFIGQFGAPSVRPFVNLAADGATNLNRVYAAQARRETESDIYVQSLESTSIFAEAYRLSRTYPATFGEIVNAKMIPRFLKVQTTSSIAAIRQNYLSLNTKIDPVIAALAIPSATRQQAAQKLISAHLAKDVSRLRAEAKVFNRQVSRHGYRAASSNHAAGAKLQNVKQEFSDAEDTVGIMSAILQLTGDKELASAAKSFEKEASALISFTDALATYTAGGAVSGFALIHSGLTAASTIASIFGGGDSADAAVLSEIQKQLQLLRAEMNAHFAALDLEIDQLFASLDRIYWSIQHLSLQVNEIQQEIAFASERLQLLDDRAGILAAAQADDAFEVQKEHCLRYEYSPRLPYSDFVYCMDAFAARSTISASNEIYTPLRARNERDYAIAVELGKPLASNFRYLNTVLADRGIGYQNAELPNPVVWMSGADAYVDIATKYPDYFFQLTAIDKLTRIAAEGTSLQEFIHDISGTTPEERAKNFQENLIKSYLRTAHSVGKMLDDRRSQILQYQLMQQPETVQVTTKSMGGCPSMVYSPTPKWDSLTHSVELDLGPLTSRAIPLEYRIVEKNNLGNLTICYSKIDLSDSQPEDTNGISWVSMNVRMRIVASIGDAELFQDNFEFRGHYVPIFDNGLLWNWVQFPSTQHVHPDFVAWLQKKLADPASLKIAADYAVKKLWLNSDFVHSTIATMTDEMNSPGNSLYNVTEALSGSKELLKNAVMVAFPLTYQNTPELQKILGESGLTDREAVLRAYSCTQNPKDPCSASDKNFADEIVKNPTNAHQIAIQAVANRYRKFLETTINSAPYDELEPSMRATAFKLQTLILLYDGHPHIRTSANQ